MVERSRAGVRASVRDAAGRCWADLVGLVVPVACGGCEALDVALCGPCGDRLTGRPERCERSAGRLDRLDGRGPLPVWATTPYTGPVRELVVAWKDRGRADLTPVLVAAARRGGRALAPVLRPVVGSARHAAAGSGALPLLVVPAPSTAPARRRRGEDLVARLAAGAASGLDAAGAPAVAWTCLTRRTGGRDQVGLTGRARGRNLAGQVAVRRRHRGRLAGRAVLLVDDVLTSGATLAACEDALAAHGARVLAGWVLAATPPPGRSSEAIGRNDPAGLA